MPDDLSLLMDAAAAAGVIACRHFKASPEVWDKPGGAGPVTEADIAVDTMLREELLASRPDYGWLSEETEDNSTRLDREKVFIVDPIDGTRAFIDGSPTWAHSLAVSELGQITAAIVYSPEHDKMYSAGRDLGAFWNGGPLK
ncbi:MAG: 3'(2'),5'-bisphosphate nucleotidase CysQ, partial [Rhodobacteraceae bacterium]|nr:3'(2'),5'-bisphosphate nucleotidase CysQ [Paracoccaceae bacterium]